LEQRGLDQRRLEQRELEQRELEQRELEQHAISYALAITYITHPIKPLNIEIQLVKCVNEPCVADICAICMENLSKVDLMITRCGHQFHSTCMITHLKQKPDCPLCRGILCK
jgi:hypothetical protein